MGSISIDDERDLEIGPFGNSATSLHAKAIGDRQRMMVGSYTVEPRPTHLNTQVGLLIDSRA